ncbi:hypothetical protein K435DRAFT_806353 [Dendrothele bispora CBS 962.96]|uniref:HAUS augmin-like complex subunit 2 n=1 Tax=Dendrothele bispora (strain CBS 962.96) TaxID=1314807 RepID=A0A4S8L8J8_DENBC|nr:hypothetical protein K435DRAFT_806353 [Dendrothele bispora CBS 962.96]
MLSLITKLCLLTWLFATFSSREPSFVQGRQMAPVSEHDNTLYTMTDNLVYIQKVFIMMEIRHKEVEKWFLSVPDCGEAFGFDKRLQSISKALASTVEVQEKIKAHESSLITNTQRLLYVEDHSRRLLMENLQRAKMDLIVLNLSYLQKLAYLARLLTDTQWSVSQEIRSSQANFTVKGYPLLERMGECLLFLEIVDEYLTLEIKELMKVEMKYRSIFQSSLAIGLYSKSSKL